MFGLEISFSEKLGNNTEEEKLDTANEYNNTSKARPARDRIAEGNSLDDDDDNHNESNETEENTKEGSESEWDGRESDDTLDSVFEKFPEGPFGFAGGSLDVFVFEPFSFKADKLPESFRIAIVFLATSDGVDHLASHETIVAGTVNHFDFADRVD